MTSPPQDSSPPQLPSAAITAASCETIQPSTHWKFRSVNPGSPHTLAREVCESLAKGSLHLESKHLAQLGFGGVGGGVGRGQLACTEGILEILDHLSLSVTSGMVDCPRSPPGTLVQALCPFPGSTSILPSPWVLFRVFIDSFLLVYHKDI